MDIYIKPEKKIITSKTGKVKIYQTAFLALTIRCQIGSRYRNTAAPIDTSGADTDASGTAPAMDHGMSGAVTITEFSISIANLC